RIDQVPVIPGFLNEVASTISHRFDGKFHAAPGRHQHYGWRLVQLGNSRQQLKALTAGGGVASIVHVQKQNVVVAGLDCFNDGSRRACDIDDKAFVLQKQLQRFEDVGLVVRDKNAF